MTDNSFVPNVFRYRADLGDGLISEQTLILPIYPSVIVGVPDRYYNDAVKWFSDDIKLPCVYFDGETIVIPEAYDGIIGATVNRFHGIIIERNAMQEHEFATLAIRAGVDSRLIRIGDAIQGLVGTPSEMLEYAMSNPEHTFVEWKKAYEASMNIM